MIKVRSCITIKKSIKEISLIKLILTLIVHYFKLSIEIFNGVVN